MGSRPDASAVLLHNALADVQAQPHTGKPPVVDVTSPLITIKDEGKVLSCDSDALIGDAQTSLPALLPHLDVNLPAFGGVFDRVVHQVFYELADSGSVVFSYHRARGSYRTGVPISGPSPTDLSHYFRQIQPLSMFRQSPLVDARGVQQLQYERAE